MSAESEFKKYLTQVILNAKTEKEAYGIANEVVNMIGNVQRDSLNRGVSHALKAIAGCTTEH